MNIPLSGRPFDDIRALIAKMPVADDGAAAKVRAREATLTKPAGSLGRLEEIAEWLAAWQGRAPPAVDRPLVAVFAGNHGVVAHGRIGLPGRGHAPDGRQLRRRRRRHQPDLPRQRSRPEGLRPRARSADRRHHAGSGARREQPAPRPWPSAWRRRRRHRSPLHRRDGHRQHHRRRGDLRWRCSAARRPTGSGRAPASTPRALARKQAAVAAALALHRPAPRRSAGSAPPPRRARDRGDGRRDPRRAPEPRAGDRRRLRRDRGGGGACTRSTRTRSITASSVTSRPSPATAARWRGWAKRRSSISACGSARAPARRSPPASSRRRPRSIPGMATFAEAGRLRRRSEREGRTLSLAGSQPAPCARRSSSIGGSASITRDCGKHGDRLGALAQLRFQLEGAVMHAHQRLHDRQAEAGALLGALDGDRALAEGREHDRDFLRRECRDRCRGPRGIGRRQRSSRP